MCYYPESDGHIRNVVKVVSDVSNYAPEKEQLDATGVHTSIFAVKRNFIALQTKTDMLDINNNFFKKVDDLDGDNLALFEVNCPYRFEKKKLSDVVSEEVFTRN